MKQLFLITLAILISLPSSTSQINAKLMRYLNVSDTHITFVSGGDIWVKTGGLPEKLKIPYGELASFSDDGNHPAYITKITENYPFKRYRGGLASDVYMYDMTAGKIDKFTDNIANDGQPSWSGDMVYFLSDQGEEIRLNVYGYNVNTKETKRLTEFKDFDISSMRAGKSDLVFEAGGQLYRMDLSRFDDWVG